MPSPDADRPARGYPAEWQTALEHARAAVAWAERVVAGDAS